MALRVSGRRRRRIMKQSYLVTVPIDNPFPIQVKDPLDGPLSHKGAAYISAQWPIVINDTYIGILDMTMWVPAARTFYPGQLVPELLCYGTTTFHKKDSAKERAHVRARPEHMSKDRLDFRSRNC